MLPKSIDLLCFNVIKRSKFLIFAVAFFSFVQHTHSQATSIRTGATFNWSDTQSTLNDPANLHSITINGFDYTTVVVPFAYEMLRLGAGGDSQNNI